MNTWFNPDNSQLKIEYTSGIDLIKSCLFCSCQSTKNLLVVPCDLEQVVVVADKGVESNALICASDLQWSGGIGCKDKYPYLMCVGLNMYIICGLNISSYR